MVTCDVTVGFSANNIVPGLDMSLRSGLVHSRENAVFNSKNFAYNLNNFSFESTMIVRRQLLGDPEMEAGG